MVGMVLQTLELMLTKVAMKGVCMYMVFKVTGCGVTLRCR
jgi:hypothetical protein